MSQAVRAAVPILMYHALSPSTDPSFTRWTLGPDRLRAHLEYLVAEGYQVVTVSQVRHRLRGGQQTGSGRVVALTFDDAYADFHRVALPLLDRYGLTATVYVPTGHVGRTSGWMRRDGEGDRHIMTWSQLGEVAACGVEVGAHSHTHPHLDRLPAESVAVELHRCKDALQTHLGVTVRTFAYPYGDYDRPVRDAVAVAGFDTACTMVPYAAGSRDDPWALPRLTIASTTDVADLATMLHRSRSRLRRIALRAERRSGVSVSRWRIPRATRRAGAR